MKQLFVVLGVTVGSATVFAQNSATPASQPGGATSAGKPLTVIGCLEATPQSAGSFRLVVPTPHTSTTRASSETTTYALTATAAVDLPGHVNEMVELTGSELPAPPQGAAPSSPSDDSSREPRSVGTSGRARGSSSAAKTTPAAEPATKSAVVAKAMTVTGVKTVATRCL